MRVNILNKMSKSKSIRSGVPQGSMLGPKLYIIYVTEMSNMFRKGRRFFFSAKTALSVFNEILRVAIRHLAVFNELLKWAHDVGLIINVRKTNNL